LSITDLEGDFLSNAGTVVYDLLKRVAWTCSENYPESAGVMYVINTPMLFTGIWAMAKNFIDEKTREKVNILGYDY